MSVLSDRSILSRMESLGNDQDDRVFRLGIDPFNPDALQGASYDLTLANDFIRAGGVGFNLSPETVHGGVLLPPQSACLASTAERIKVPYDCVVRVEGKSSLGRQFILVHCTSGWCDPGFMGNVTLEIVNLHPTHSFILEPGMPIAQLTVLTLDREAERVYQGRYQGATGTEGAKA